MIERLSLSDVHALAHDCLTRAGAPEAVAEAVAAEITASEAAGERHHGLEALLRDIRLMRYGRIDACAKPSETRPRPGLICCDAGHGFAAAALAGRLDPLADLARQQGIALLRLDRASDPGAMIHATETLARNGLAALAFGSGGAGRVTHPDNPIAALLPHPPGNLLALMLAPRHTGQPADSPLNASVAHGAWIVGLDVAFGGEALFSAEIWGMIAPPPTARDIAFPTDLLERIVTA